MLTVFSHSVAFVSDSLQLHGLPARHVCPRGFSRQEYWSRLPCPPPEDIPNPGIKPMSPPLQMYSLLSELLGNLKNTGVDSLSLLQGIFLTQESNLGSPALQADSLPAEPQGKPKNTGVGRLALLQQIFLTEESNQGLLHRRQILYQLSYEGNKWSLLEGDLLSVSRWGSWILTQNAHPDLLTTWK